MESEDVERRGGEKPLMSPGLRSHLCALFVTALMLLPFFVLRVPPSSPDVGGVHPAPLTILPAEQEPIAIKNRGIASIYAWLHLQGDGGMQGMGTELAGTLPALKRPKNEMVVGATQWMAPEVPLAGRCLPDAETLGELAMAPMMLFWESAGGRTAEPGQKASGAPFVFWRDAAGRTLLDPPELDAAMWGKYIGTMRNGAVTRVEMTGMEGGGTRRRVILRESCGVPELDAAVLLALRKKYVLTGRESFLSPVTLEILWFLEQGKSGDVPSWQ